MTVTITSQSTDKFSTLYEFQARRRISAQAVREHYGLSEGDTNICAGQNDISAEPGPNRFRNIGRNLQKHMASSHATLP